MEAARIEACARRPVGFFMTEDFLVLLLMCLGAGRPGPPVTARGRTHRPPVRAERRWRTSSGWAARACCSNVNSTGRALASRARLRAAPSCGAVAEGRRCRHRHDDRRARHGRLRHLLGDRADRRLRPRRGARRPLRDRHRTAARDRCGRAGDGRDLHHAGRLRGEPASSPRPRRRAPGGCRRASRRRGRRRPSAESPPSRPPTARPTGRTAPSERCRCAARAASPRHAAAAAQVAAQRADLRRGAARRRRRRRARTRSGGTPRPPRCRRSARGTRGAPRSRSD